MTRQQLIIVGVGLMSIVLLGGAACSPVRKAHAVEGAVVVEVSSPVNPKPVAQSPSCANPSAELAATCEAQSAKILASTVRLEFHGQGGGIGHATVVGGRYLITHNHYPTSGETLSRGRDGSIDAVSVLKANGEVILLKAPLSYFSVTLIAPEALVLDFGEYSGVGFFDSLGVPSVEVGPLTNVDIRPGSEVAQIDWDMTTARVTWVRVAAVHTDSGVPCMELNSFVEQGASGGGVFYNGIHIANNWSRNTDREANTGEVLRQYSLAALNAPNVVALDMDAPNVASMSN